MQINLGTTVTTSSNGGATQTPGQSELLASGHAPPPSSNGTNQQPGQGAPRVIRITHQTMEPVVMMQMNIDSKPYIYYYYYYNVCLIS